METRLCCSDPRLTADGSYPLRCPVESRLSSAPHPRHGDRPACFTPSFYRRGVGRRGFSTEVRLVVVEGLALALGAGSLAAFTLESTAQRDEVLARLRPAEDDAVAPEAAPLLAEIRTRLRFLCDVGLGYLTLDRQSRTLSGGEVQRINLTTALGTSLVNTMFVLDEPSIGLHPRDMGRVIEVMRNLRAVGNEQSHETLRRAGRLRADLQFGRIDEILAMLSGLRQTLSR